jgi:hypothetical protein
LKDLFGSRKLNVGAKLLVEYQVRTPEKSVSDTATSMINALAADTTAFDTTFREEVATAGESSTARLRVPPLRARHH